MILIVDDQKNMGWILSKVLADAGFAVVTAETAADALAIAIKSHVTVACNCTEKWAKSTNRVAKCVCNSYPVCL